MIHLVRNDKIGGLAFAIRISGVKVWTASYSPFGEVRTPTGNPIAACFPGQWYQAESGLHQNWMRDYDPTTGRYIPPDPLGLIDGSSIYGYAWQNPGRWLDPRGTYSEAATGPLAGLICASNPLCDAALIVAACGIGMYAIYEWWNYDPPLVSAERAPGEPGPEDG